MPIGGMASRGDTLSLSADELNAMREVARWFRTRPIEMIGKPGGVAERAFDRLRVRNDDPEPSSGTGAFPAFGAVELGEPAIMPEAAGAGLWFRPVLSAVTPTADAGTKLGIPLEPIPVDHVGKVCVAGICPVKLDVTDEAHGFAAAVEGDNAKLASAASGGLEVIWKQSGTGTRWALVRLGGGGGGGAVFVKVVARTNQAVYSTYTVHEINASDGVNIGNDIPNVFIKDDNDANGIPANTVVGPLLTAPNGILYCWPFAIVR